MERYELAKNRIMVQKTQNSEKNGQTIFTKK